MKSPSYYNDIYRRKYVLRKLFQNPLSRELKNPNLSKSNWVNLQISSNPIRKPLQSPGFRRSCSPRPAVGRMAASWWRRTGKGSFNLGKIGKIENHGKRYGNDGKKKYIYLKISKWWTAISCGDMICDREWVNSIFLLVISKLELGIWDAGACWAPTSEQANASILKRQPTNGCLQNCRP